MIKDQNLQMQELLTLGGSVAAHDASLQKIIDEQDSTIGLLTRSLEAST